MANYFRNSESSKIEEGSCIDWAKLDRVFRMMPASRTNDLLIRAINDQPAAGLQYAGRFKKKRGQLLLPKVLYDLASEHQVSAFVSDISHIAGRIRYPFHGSRQARWLFSVEFQCNMLRRHS